MRSPRELDQVCWADLDGGDEASTLIRMLYEGSVRIDVDEKCELTDSLYNVGTVYPASVAAVPFLAHASLHATRDRDWAVFLLAAFIEEAPRKGRPQEELERELHAAVGAEAHHLLPCLADSDPDIRRMGLRVLGGRAAFLGAERAGVTAGVLDAFDRDRDPQVRADALTALELLEDTAAFVDRIERAAASEDRLLRLIGAICALEVGYMPGSGRWDVLAGDVGVLEDGLDDFPAFPVLGSRVDRLNAVLHR